MRDLNKATKAHILNKSIFDSEQINCLFCFLYWPLYGIAFAFVERFYKVDSYNVMHCSLDDKIPFCEWFIIPYMFWFVYLIGMIVYSFCYEPQLCRKFMRFVIITYTFAIITYFVYPTSQHLRPDSFERRNLLTRFIRSFYEFDTNTNVCPSIHVIGTIGVMLAVYNSKTIESNAVRCILYIVGILICLSTVFLKQHSLIDVFAGVIVSIIGAVGFKDTISRIHKADGSEKV